MLQEFIIQFNFNEIHHYKFLFESLSIGVTFRDKKDNLIFANAAALEILGLTFDEIKNRRSLNNSWKTIREDGTDFPTEEHPSIIALKKNEKVNNVIMGICLPNIKKIKWINIQAIPYTKDKSNEPYGVYTSFEDITLKKDIQSLEEKNTQQLQKIHSDLLQKQVAIDYHAIISITDYEGKITFVNKRFCKVSQYSETELLGKNHRITNSNYHSRFFFQSMYETISKGEIWHGEIRNQAKDRSYYWVATTIVPLLNIDGNIDQFISIRTDITEQKKLQDAYRISEAKMRALFDNYPQSVLFIDKNKKLQFFNEIASERNQSVFGSFLKIGESIHKYVIKSEMESFDNHFNQCVRGEIIKTEKQIKTGVADRWFEFQYTPVKNDQQEIIGVLYTVNDIDYRKRKEQEAEQNEKRFRNIFDQAPIGVSLIDSLADNLKQINRQFCQILGYTEEEMLNLEFDEIISPEDLEPYHENMRKLNSGIIKLFTMEVRYIKKDGNLVWTHVTCVPLWTDKDTVKLNLRIITDITDRKTVEEINLRYTKDLESLNQSKDKFFSIIAHDLRNPFSGIIGISEILEEELLELAENNSTQALQYTRMIQVASKSAFNLLENLMQWVRSQSGHISLNQLSLSIEKAVESVLPVVESNAFKKDIRIELKISDKHRVYADFSLLSTILRNLLTNAIKFSYQGGVILISSERQESFLEISISDSGVGMEQARLEKIFRIDSKFSSSGTANEKGTGLGLILCKEFIEKQGGTIWAESELGIGSKFTFTLPLGV